MVLAILFLIDLYVYQAIQYTFKGLSGTWQQIIKYSYWGLTGIVFSLILFYNFGNPDLFEGNTRALIFTFIFINYFSKTFSALFLIADDLIRLGKWAVNQVSPDKPAGLESEKITRK